MKKILVVVFIFAMLALSFWLVGCKENSSKLGGSVESDDQAISLLKESSQAMSEVSSYRMAGNLSMPNFGISE